MLTLQLLSLGPIHILTTHEFSCAFYCTFQDTHIEKGSPLYNKQAKETPAPFLGVELCTEICVCYPHLGCHWQILALHVWCTLYYMFRGREQKCAGVKGAIRQVASAHRQPIKVDARLISCTYTDACQNLTCGQEWVHGSKFKQCALNNTPAPAFLNLPLVSCFLCASVL